MEKTKVYKNTSSNSFCQRSFLSSTQTDAAKSARSYIDVMMGSDDGSLTEDNTLFKWNKLLKEAAIKLDKPFEETSAFENIMAEVGFTNIVTERFKWPTNYWAEDKMYKEIGAWNNKNTKDALESLTMAPFTRAFGWSSEKVNVFLVNVRKDLDDLKIHAYWPICSVYGRKPEA